MEYKEFFILAESKGIENIQITEETKKENSIYLINTKLEDYTDCEKITYLIKAEVNGKTEQVYTEYLDESIIDLILEKINTTESNYKDEFLKVTNNNTLIDLPLVDITEENIKLNKLNNLKENYPLIKNLETVYSDVYTKTRIINNKGVDVATSSHNYELYVEASAEEDDNISTYSESILESDKSKIDFSRIINNALNLATIAVNKKHLKTKKYNVILNNKVTASIINELQTMLSAQNIHQKKSYLENKLDEKIFSDKLTIVEEPQNIEYPGYTIFDKEGTKTRNKTLVENGIIKTYLYDIKEAKVDKKSSTGNKYNGIGTRNMYIVPGEQSLDELLKAINNGLYITHYMGSMGALANTSSGNISIQVFGYIIENGKIVSGFTPSILTTTITELLSNIEAVGNDLTFREKEVGCPSLYIKDISIAAE